ncbi:hemerythrin domain-containing protein, partial [Arthrospira platensis SPKY1]|nr:hemerythrin domain-containing protein [Arthrospira platensis SPKY1]
MEEATEKPSGNLPDFPSWSPDLLCDYIEKTHHRYVADSIPALHQYLDKVTLVHGGRHPELLEVFQLFREVAEELLSHMEKEEVILFPYVRAMVEQQRSGSE